MQRGQKVSSLEQALQCQMQLWLLKPRKERTWNGQDQSQHKMANDDSFLLQHRAKICNQKTAYKFYIKAITVKKNCFKTRDSVFSCIVLSKYRREQLQNSAECVLFKHSVSSSLHF